MQIEQKNLEQRNHELMEACKEKSRNQQQVQRLYQSLKAQVMASQVASAASDDAEIAINTVTGTRFTDRLESQSSRPRAGPFSAGPTALNRSHRHVVSHGPASNAEEHVGISPVVRSYSARMLNVSSIDCC